MGAHTFPHIRGNHLARCKAASSDAEVRRALQGNTCPELFHSAPVNCAVLPRTFRALTQASNECHFALATPPDGYWGLLRPGFSEIEIEKTQVFSGQVDLNSHRGGVAQTKSTLTAVPAAYPLVE